MATHISADEAARIFAELLERVRNRGEEFIVESDGKPVCRITPPPLAGISGADFARLWREIPKPDPAYWDDVEEAVRNQPPMSENPWDR